MESNNSNNNVLKFIGDTLILFAVTILLLIILAAFFGDAAGDSTTIYQFGNRGLASSTLLQFLLSSTVTTALRCFYFSEVIFKRMMTLWRTILMLFSVLASNLIFIILFKWFTLDNLYAWIGFLLFFFGGAVMGSLVMILKTRLESRQYNQLLSNYKKTHWEENDYE